MPIGEFYTHSQMGDGHLNKCKACVRQRVRTHRAVNEHVREYDRERAKTPARRSARKRVVGRWGSENPVKKKATYAVNNAVRDGRIEKLPCHFCGADESLEAHHHDYARPLDVVWLCVKCHRRYHALHNLAMKAEIPH